MLCVVLTVMSVLMQPFDPFLTHWPLLVVALIFLISNFETHVKDTHLCYLEIVLRWIPRNTFDDESKLVQVKAWWLTAPRHQAITSVDQDLSLYAASL